jgi:hypothetical protein
LYTASGLALMLPAGLTGTKVPLMPEAEESVPCSWVLPLPVETVAITLSREEVPLIFTSRISGPVRSEPRIFLVYPTAGTLHNTSYFYCVLFMSLPHATVI